MRVALDEQIFAIQPYGGISRMFAELAHQFSLGVVPDVELVPFQAPVVNRYVLDDEHLSWSLGAYESRSPWLALARYLTHKRPRNDTEIIHNTFYLPYGLSRSREAKRVVTIHDMIPELFPESRRRLDWLTWKRRYVTQADHIICVSESTKRDLLGIYGELSTPISVVHHGVSPRFRPSVPKADFLPGRYLLHVGHRTQYKDAETYYRAFARLAPKYPDLHLLCVGGDGLSEAESNFLRSLGIRDRVSQRFLPDELMASAYAYADIFVFPSRYEGFGLPALEAMSCGTPTVLARASSLPEVGGDAAVYFEPGSDQDLALILQELLEDPRRRSMMTERGLTRSAHFGWPRAAKATFEVYQSALAGEGRATLSSP